MFAVSARGGCSVLTAVSFENIKVGDEIPSITHQPSHIQLFRFSAITWNAHRIHYDKDYAREEGYPDIIVHAHLYGAFLEQMLLNWVHPYAQVRKLQWSNRRYATVGEPLTCKGVVKSCHRGDGEEGIVECDIWVENSAGEACAVGQATLVFPPLSEEV